MATSSITHNFVISKPNSVKSFIDAVDAAEHDQTPQKPLPVKHLTNSKEISSFIKRREALNGK